MGNSEVLQNTSKQAWARVARLTACVCVFLAIALASGRAYAVTASSGLTADSSAATGFTADSSAQVNAGSRLTTEATFTPVIAEGAYQFKSASQPTRVLTAADTTQDGVTQLVGSEWANDATQKYYVRMEGDGLYSIQSASTGKFLTDKKGVVVLRNWKGSSTQLWSAKGKKRIRFTNAATGNALSLSGKSKAGQANVAGIAPGKSADQRWRLSSKPLLATGFYYLRSGLGTYLTVKNGACYNGANILAQASRDPGSQCFRINVSGRWCRIKNMKSFKMADVDGISKKNGANVHLWESHGGANQKWKISLDRAGRMVFTSANSGKALTVKGDEGKPKANVVQYRTTGKKNQGWRLVPTQRYSLSGDSELDRQIADILATHTSLYSAYEHVRDDYSWNDPDTAYRSGRYLGGENTTRYAKEMIDNGSGSCYCSSSLFMWLARGLGYDAYVSIGYLQSNIPGVLGAHSWVEIWQDGVAYACDPDCERGYRDHDWFMRTYDESPAEYHFW